MADLNRQLNEDGTVCCGDEKWRGRLCDYHQGLQDGTPESLTDDQIDRLRELVGPFDLPWTVVEPGEDWPSDTASIRRPDGIALEIDLDLEFAELVVETINALPALLDENDQLRKHIIDLAQEIDQYSEKDTAWAVQWKELKANSVPKAVHETTKAFYGLTVQQRDLAWAEVQQLQECIKALESGGS